MTEENRGNKDTHNEQNAVAPNISESKRDLDAFSREINLTAKTLDARANDMGRRLSQSLKDLESTITLFQSTFEEQNKQNKAFAKDLDTFALLPERLASNIKEIVPQIAEELVSILGKNMEPFQQKFDLIQKELEASLSAQQEKLNLLTIRLTEDAIEATSANWKKFLIRLVITAVFAVGVSALTSYLVTVRYPRFIEITGAHDVRVQDSDVKIWGEKVKDK